MMASENHFDRLPAELIISIFEKLLDAKWLCVCCSVSKHFAAHVVQTHLVFVQISFEISPYGWPPVWPPGVINFLKKLCYVKSATMQFNIRNLDPSSQPLVRRKSDSFQFIFVLAESRVDNDISAADIKAFTMEECDAFFGSILNHMCDFSLRLSYIEELLDVLPNLKNVSTVDPTKRGSIDLGEEGIANVMEGRRAKFELKMWFAHMVELPFSKCIMENVAFISATQIDGNLMVKNTFEEREYHEVATTMMKKRSYFSLGDPTVGRGTIACFPAVSLVCLRTQSFWRTYMHHMQVIRRYG